MPVDREQPVIEQQPSLRLYRHPLSGHSHRVQLFLSLLDLQAEYVDVDIVQGAHKQPDFLAKNPLGQIPVLEDGDLTLTDSNAILVYLALRYDPARRWYPEEPVIAAQVQRWLSVAAGELVNGPAIARVTRLFKRPNDLDKAQAQARDLFDFLERHLAECSFLASEEPTIADLALHTYTAHAPEGGVPLDDYPNIRAWLRRIEVLPGFVAMQATPTG